MIYKPGSSQLKSYLNPTRSAIPESSQLKSYLKLTRSAILESANNTIKGTNMTNHNPNILECQSCYHSVISQIHANRCNTSSMYEIKEFYISPEFKPMMTFGLGGCTALLMVFFSKDTNQVKKVVLGHHPIKENILKWFREYYTQDYNIVIIIKTPGNYKKVNDFKYYILVPEDEEYWELYIQKDNCKLILESYNLLESTDFNNSLYFKIKDGPKYSDIYGRYIDINY